MPQYKVLKSAAHNIGHSFVSLMNFSDGCPVKVTHRMQARVLAVLTVQAPIDKTILFRQW
jgi:hypothetical protein